MVFRARGFAPRRKDGTRDNCGNEFLEIVLEVLVTANGKPLEARTYLFEIASGMEAECSSTGAIGVARYDVPVGEYRIRVRRDDIDAKDRFTRHIQGKAGKTSRLSIDFPTAE